MAPWCSRRGVSGHNVGDGKVFTRLYSPPTKETGTTYPPFESELFLRPAFIDRRKTGQVSVLACNRSDSFSGNSAVALETSQVWRCCYHIGKPQSKVSHRHQAIAHKCLSQVNWTSWAQFKRPADSWAKWVTVVLSHQVFESCTRQEESQAWSEQSREQFPSLEHFAWGQMLGNRPVSYTHKHPRGVCERLMYKWPLWIPSTANSHTGAST